MSATSADASSLGIAVDVADCVDMVWPSSRVLTRQRHGAKRKPNETLASIFGEDPQRGGAPFTRTNTPGTCVRGLLWRGRGIFPRFSFLSPNFRLSIDREPGSITAMSRDPTRLTHLHESEHAVRAAMQKLKSLYLKYLSFTITYKTFYSNYIQASFSHGLNTFSAILLVYRQLLGAVHIS